MSDLIAELRERALGLGDFGLAVLLTRAADALEPRGDVVERVARAIRDAIAMDMQSAREAAKAALGASHE